MDRLQFQLPESWADCAIALYLRRSDGTQLAPVPLDGDACVTVDRRLTGCTGGPWMLAAVSGSGYTAYTRPGRYDACALSLIHIEYTGYVAHVGDMKSYFDENLKLIDEKNLDALFPKNSPDVYKRQPA